MDTNAETNHEDTKTQSEIEEKKSICVFVTLRLMVGTYAERDKSRV
jgi:hypothetical protein